MNRRFLRAILAMLVAASTGLVACGDDPKEDTGDNNSNQVSADMGNTNNSVDDAGNMESDTGNVAECPEPTGVRPPQISEHGGAFVPSESGGQIVMFGGSLGIPENCGFPERTYETTTWLYDVSCDSWSRVESSITPPGRTRHQMVYDSVEDRVLLFGGLGPQGPLADTWALDMETMEWSEVQTNQGPAPRLNFAAAYDPAGRLVIIGGNTGPSVVSINPVIDVWVLDLSTNEWIERTPTVSGPVPRLWVSGLWDENRSQMVIFGGGDDSAFTGTVEYLKDVWAWKDDGGTPGWIKLDGMAEEQPQGRFWAGWVRDETNDRYVLFAGHDDTDLGNKNDTWFFDPDSGQWSEHLAGDIPNKPPNGFCDFPADFTLVEQESPERRNGHIFVAGPNGGYAMGGKTDCGIVDDLTRFNFATDTWETLTRATAGEVCLRRGGGDSCTSMCL